jgi:L-fuconolactonase
MTIDSHHHFWRYGPEDFGWIDESMSAIRRDFLPVDLEPAINAAGIDGVVSVQARQTMEETEWLLQMAGENDFISGVVGWVPLVDADVRDHLARYATNSNLRSVRHVLHDEPDDNYMLRDDFNAGIDALREFGLAYDILIFERHLPQTIEFVDRHPEQVFIVDHVAKPRIKDNMISPWRENMMELGKRDNVYCKLSGMVTEADFTNWTEEQLTPYMDGLLGAFGANRVMFGSDWPVCLVGCVYERWVRIVEEYANNLSVDERNRIMGDTAIEAYRL